MKQDVLVELFQSGVWHDVTADDDVRAQQPIAIIRGTGDGEQQLQPAIASLVLDNRDGRYGLRNPNSPLFGLIGRNTPLRISTGTPHVGAAGADLTDTTAHVAPSVDSPTDDAMLLCAWAAPDPANTYTLPGGMTAGGSTTDARTSMDSAFEAISSAGATGTRTATFSASEDSVAASVLLHGTGLRVEWVGGFSTDFTASSPSDAGDWWVVFSYAGWDEEGAATPLFPRDTDGGGWILLADSGEHQPGDAEAAFFRVRAWGKRVKTSGSHTIWVDNPGLVLSIQSVYFRLSGVTDWSMRFHGEVAQWPTDPTVGGHDVVTPIQAADLTRRIGRQQTSRRDTVARFVDQNRSVCIDYWPLSDPAGSDRSKSSIGGRPLRPALNILTARPQYGSGRGAPWLPAMLETSRPSGSELGGSIEGSVSGDSGGWSIDLIYQTPFPAVWADDWPQQLRMVVLDGEPGSAVEWSATLTPADEPLLLSSQRHSLELEIEVESGTTEETIVDFPDQLADGRPHHIRLRAFEQGGTGGALFIDVDGVNVTSLLHSDIGTAAIKAPREVILQWLLVSDSNGDPTARLPLTLGQVTMWQEPVPGLANSATAYFGHQAETPSRRYGRICREERIPCAVIGDVDQEEVLLGPQYPDRVLDILTETARAGGGWQHAAREFSGLVYRIPASAYNSPAVFSRAADAGGLLPLRPVPDDQQTANDVTATSRLGAVSARSVQAAGPLNVQLPEDDPQGIGPVELPITRNVLPDERLVGNQARWRRHLGTADEDRLPALVVDLVAGPSIVDEAAAVDVADRIVITSPPPWMAPENVDQLAQGYTEVIGTHTRQITFVGLPGAPYHIAEVEHPLHGILQSDSATLDEALDTTETAVDIDCGAGPDWIHEVDFDLLIGGERVTVTAVAAMTGTFPARKTTLTVTRSVNGVVKSHTAGTRVDFLNKSYIGL